MTCEIAIMNMHAVALAADSATTVTQFINGTEEKRFFKGANKIFQLSNHHPVGLMIFGTANLQKIPWEILVKDFRKNLGEKSFNKLNDYAKEFFDYITNHRQLLTQDYQEEVFIDVCVRAAFLITSYFIVNNEEIKSAETNEIRSALINQNIDSQIESLEGEDLPVHFTQDDIDHALGSHQAEITRILQERFQHIEFEYTELIPFEKLADLAITSIFKNYYLYLSNTGVVIAGYGDTEYFPSYYQYNCYGLVLGKFIYDTQEEKHIDVQNQSNIKPFATTSMVHTFETGISPDLFDYIRDELKNSLQELCESIKRELNIEEIPNNDALINNTITTHTEQMGTARGCQTLSPITKSRRVSTYRRNGRTRRDPYNAPILKGKSNPTD